jgi:hypothetical protein
MCCCAVPNLYSRQIKLFNASNGLYWEAKHFLQVLLMRWTSKHGLCCKCDRLHNCSTKHACSMHPNFLFGEKACTAVSQMCYTALHCTSAPSASRCCIPLPGRHPATYVSIGNPEHAFAIPAIIPPARSRVAGCHGHLHCTCVGASS